jgi:spermidine synthase
MNGVALNLSLIVMGLSGIVGQMVLLRELLVSFYGNEMTLGIILANWLIIEAIGSFWIGKSVEWTERKLEVYALLQLLFAASLPIALHLARVFKNIIVTTPGEGLGFLSIFYSSFLVLLPVSLFHGALFTYGCKLCSQVSIERAASLGKVYVLETIGTLSGGLLITFVLIPYLNSFSIVFLVSLMNSLMALSLLRRGRGPKNQLQKIIGGFSAALSLVFAGLLIPPLPGEIDFSSLQSQWKGMDILLNENSIYGNITVTKQSEQYTFFTNGTPSVTTPVPDLAFVQDIVHFPFLFHPNPKTVLVLHGGAGGMLQEILKHPVTRVDYVELDPLLLKLIQKFPTPITQSEFSDQRVKVHDRDSRLFVKNASLPYDVILLGLPAPQELQSNRLFTSEFFSIAKQKLAPEGMIVLTLPGSTTYISPDLRDLTGCLLDTLRSVFAQVRIIPGDVNLCLASSSDALGKVSPDEVVERFKERGIKTSLFTEGYLRDRLQETKLAWFLQSMEKRGIHINSDFRPLAVFYGLSYWNALFSPYLARIFKGFERHGLPLLLLFLFLFTLFSATASVKKPLLARHTVTYAIFTSGFSGMIFELAIVFAFQTLYGYLYHQMGLLVAIFMGGVASGGFCINRILEKIERDSLLFLAMEACIVVFSLLLPVVFSLSSSYLESSSRSVLLYAVFLSVSFVSGILIGAQFPLAGKIYLRSLSREASLGPTAGLLYGADLFGGFFGGLFGGMLLLPVLGLVRACVIVAIIKLTSFTLFLLYVRIKEPLKRIPSGS